MKWLKYRTMTEVCHVVEENPQIEQVFYNCVSEYNEKNLAIAQSIAYNGEVKVEDVPDEPREPTQEEQLRADVDFLSVMTGVTL